MFSKLFITVVIIIGFNRASCLELNVPLVIDFMNQMKLSCGVVFYCENSLDFKKWGSIIGNERKYLSFFDMTSHALYESNVQKTMRLDYRNLGVIIDTTCANETKKLFKICSQQKFFNASFNWLMFANDYNESIAILKLQNINYDAEITLALFDANGTNISLFDIYNPSFKYKTEMVISLKGTYNDFDRLKFTLKGSKLSQRRDFQGTNFNVGIVATGVQPNQTLEDYLETYENPTVDAQHRHQYGLHKILSEKYNYSFLLHRAPTWGFLRNGSYDGILRMFITNQIDFSISPFRHTIDRSYFIDYTLTTFITAPEILFRHPKNTLRNPFLLPLSPTVWYLILIIMFTSSLLITLTMRIDKVKNETFVRAFMTSIGVMCQQGFMENYYKLSTRTLLMVFILFSSIIYQFYSSFIVSSLLISPPKTINDLKQLIDSNIEVGIEDVAYNHDFFETSTDKLVLELYNKKIMKSSKNGNFFSVECGIEKMQKCGFAFQVDTAYAYRIIAETFDDEEICEIHQMLLFPYRPLANVFEKKSPLSELFKVEFLRFKETGLLQYQDTKWQKKKPKCMKSITKIKGVDLEETSCVFLLLVAAFIGSLMIVVLENVYFQVSRKTDTKRKQLKLSKSKVIRKSTR